MRVDDPDLVTDLEKAGVKFTGVAPSFLSEFLWAWILPIGLMVLLWVFLSRTNGRNWKISDEFWVEPREVGRRKRYPGEF